MIFLFIFLFTSFLAFPQDNLNIQYLSHYVYDSELSDIWGYSDGVRELAIVGVYDGISVVDVTNSLNPVELAFFDGPNSEWRDIKTNRNYVYCVNETSGGLQIFDINGILSPLVDTFYFENLNLGFLNAHNIYIDENEILYVFNPDYGNIGVKFYNLINPYNPSFLGEYSLNPIHDGMVRGDTMWASSTTIGSFQVIDVTDKSNPVLLASQYTPNYFSHNCWISDDNHYLFTTDEVTGAHITSYDVSNILNIQELDRIQSWSNSHNVIPHNTFFINNFLVTSYYTSGVTIIDANNPNNLVEVGYYDTSIDYSGSGFHGAWGVYPYLPSGKLLVSDIENGLFILEPSYENAIRFEGNIYDKYSDLPIQDVEIKFSNSNHTNYSNFLGYYSSGSILGDNYFISFNKDNYFEKVISIDSTYYEDNILDVKLIPSFCFDDSLQNTFIVVMNVISGDEFQGVQLNIDGETFEFNNGYELTDTICVDKEVDCLNINFNSDSIQSQVLWKLIDNNNNIIFEGNSQLDSIYCFEYCQEISLNSGWNIFSTYLNFSDNSIDQVLNQLTTNNNLVIVKDYMGNVFLPDWNYNSIGDLKFKEGYLLKLNNIQELHLCGKYMNPEDNPIHLNEGWSMISYLRKNSLEAESIFQEIVDEILIVKDVLGQVYFPLYNYNGLGNLKPGKGYLIKMHSNQVLDYSQNN